MDPAFSYRHLYYFWVVGREGGMSRGAARLGMAVQTVSAQVRELERALGHALFRPAGRGIALTPAGEAAMRQAEQIFQLGGQLPSLVRDAAEGPVLRLAVGIPDSLPKLVVRHLMEPVMDAPHLRLVCHEDRFDELLAELALHRLDVVLGDRSAPTNASLRLHSHALGSAPVDWYAPERLAREARRGFPQSLARVPVLLPTAHSAVRPLLERWFEREGVRPDVVGEFEDSALLKTFGAAGMGVFPSASLVREALVARYRVRHVGTCEGVSESFYAIGTERRIQHPLLLRMIRPRSDAGHAP